MFTENVIVLLQMLFYNLNVSIMFSFRGALNDCCKNVPISSAKPICPSSYKAELVKKR